MLFMLVDHPRVPRPSSPGRFTVIALAFSVLFVSQRFVWGQTTPPAAEKAPTYEEAVEKATEILDRLESHWGEQPGREDVDQLSTYVTAIQRSDPTDPRVDYLFGRAFAAMGRSGAAISTLERFVSSREGRNEWKAYRILGDSYVEDYPRQALKKYEKAAALKPDEPTILLGVSKAHFKVGENAKALEYAIKAADADAGAHVQPIAHLARMYGVNQQWPEADRTAVAAVEKAQERLRSDPARRGPLLALQDQYDLLIEILQSQMTATGATADKFARVGRYMRERAAAAQKLALHDTVVLLENGMRFLKTDPSADLLLEYGISMAELGRNAEAAEAMNRVLKMEPDNGPAKAWLSRLRTVSPASAPADQP